MKKRIQFRKIVKLQMIQPNVLCLTAKYGREGDFNEKILINFVQKGVYHLNVPTVRKIVPASSCCFHEFPYITNRTM